MAKPVQKLQARMLRRQGKSIGSIAKKVHVSKGSVSLWCADIPLTPQQMKKLLQSESAGIKRGQLVAAEHKRQERQQRIEQYQLNAFHDIENLSQRDLFMLGVGLYWGEGSKRNKQVALANTDPNIIKLFLLFMNAVCQKPQDDVKYRIQVNSDHQDRYPEIVCYWSKVLGVPKERFMPPSYIHTKHKKIYEHRGTYYGTLQIVYAKSTNQNYQLVGLINAVKYWIDHCYARVAQW